FRHSARRRWPSRARAEARRPSTISSSRWCFASPLQRLDTQARRWRYRVMADRGAAPALASKRRASNARAEAALYAAVAAGSVIGSVLRWLAGLALPWGPLFVNLTGSFAIGFFAGMSAPGGRWFVGPRLRQFFMTGICGGYTTFSMFSLEALRLLQQGKLALAPGYIALFLVALLWPVLAGAALSLKLTPL